MKERVYTFGCTKNGLPYSPEPPDDPDSAQAEREVLFQLETDILRLEHLITSLSNEAAGLVGLREVPVSHPLFARAIQAHKRLTQCQNALHLVVCSTQLRFGPP